MRLIFIRHGDPDYARDSLTPRGQAEAALLAERAGKWNVSAVYCSPLGRAQATAAPTLQALGMQAVTLNWLQEFEAPFPDAEGRPIKAWDLLPADWMQDPALFDRKKWMDAAVFQSSPVKPMYLAACQAFDDFLAGYGFRRKGDAYTAGGSEDTVLLFTHMGITNVLLSHLMNVSPLILWNAFYMVPTSITVLHSEARDGETAIFRCQQIGDTAHLWKAGAIPAGVGYFPVVTFEG